MIISLENLCAGVEWWKKVKPGWGLDFVNSEYEAIYPLRADGLTGAWWADTVDRLWNWKAIRARERPNTKKEIRTRGCEHLPAIESEFRKIKAISNEEPSISDIQWRDISELFELSFQIKCGNRRLGSPVFASKMCHFIFPRIFPVIDNLATGVFDYEFYWRGMKSEWDRFSEKNEAIEHLRSEIKSQSIHKLYPFETKIIELSHIGYAHSQRPSLTSQEPADLESFQRLEATADASLRSG